jgi:hypothetical protein
MSKQASLTALRPTQMTLGLREVARRRDQIRQLDAAGRKAYVAARAVPCVLGPGKHLYMIDRHHMCRALLDAGLDTANYEVVCDVTGLAEVEFWRFMDLRSWVHPFDQNGNRCAVGALPVRIADLADDPYRALAGFLRRGNGFTKADMPFEEFIWADFLRYRIPAGLVQSDFEKASAQALKLARSNAARHLPGWRGAD